MRNTIIAANLFFSKPIKQTVLFIGYIVMLIILFIAVININIVAKTNDNIITVNELDKVANDFDCIIILGAGIRADGSPTPMLNDRLTVGLKAFEQNKSQVILLSGDSESSDYTETVTMSKVLIENGVPHTTIISDGYGLSTYESMYRAKEIYGCEKILIVSQKYHLYRAIYIAEELGMTAYGLNGALQGYSKQVLYELRELLARIKDMLYSEMRPTPEYTYVWEEIYE